jgi:choline dehydrogenase
MGEAGATGWDYRSVVPYFTKVEATLIPSDLRNDHACCNAWIEAGKHYGLPYNPNFNHETTYGVGPTSSRSATDGATAPRGRS